MAPNWLKNHEKRGISSIIGGIFVVVIMVAGIAAILSISGMENNVLASQNQVAKIDTNKNQESLIFAAPVTGTSWAAFNWTNTGPQTVQLVSLIILDNNGHHFWNSSTSPAFSVTILPNTFALLNWTSYSPPSTGSISYEVLSALGNVFVAQPQASSSTLVSPASPTVTSSSNSNTCTDVTSGTAKMAGFGLSYTTNAGSSGSLYISLTFNVAEPATSGVSSSWILDYGTGSAPACNAATSGTTVGQSYTIATEAAAAGGEAQTIAVTLTGLSANTAYWFDVQVTDSSAASWIYSNPALSVTDILTSGYSTPDLALSTNTHSCTISSTTAGFAGFGTTYATNSSGNVQVSLTFNVASPATTALTSKWELFYGTGTAPTCAQASTGTSAGNQYTVETEAAVVLKMAQNERVTITGLSAKTTYWFDVLVTDSSTGSWAYSNPTLAIVEQQTTTNLPSNIIQTTSSATCSDATATTAHMMGLGTTFVTTSSTTGSVFVSLAFNIASPATSGLTSKWTVAYGTGTMPACNAAPSGTTVGKQYIVETVAASAGAESQSEQFALTGLNKGTQYWIDVQVSDSTTGTWVYSLGAISIMDIQPADYVHNNAYFTSGTASCAKTTTAATMAGLGVEFTTSSYGTGNVVVTLNFEITMPATSKTTAVWIVAYGTGSNPACNAAVSGTTVGQSYEFENPAAVATVLPESETFVLDGLSHATNYWIDIQVTDSVTTSTTYSLPSLSVTEIS